jgi:hypothetical protein
MTAAGAPVHASSRLAGRCAVATSKALPSALIAGEQIELPE